jgi:hypothetical protein
MSHIQPAFDGNTLEAPAPATRRVADDYDAWISEVWPHYIAAAATGRAFTLYEIADANQLPEPPHPRAHWGRLATLLREAGYTRAAGWATSSRPTARHSAVRTWRGTTAARKAAA